MTQAELEASIVTELTTELKNETGFDADMLEAKVHNAYREVKTVRNYPKYYPQGVIDDDMEAHYSYIKAIALYDYTKIGAEGQESYSADGETIKYSDRKTLFAGVLPFARVF